MRQYLHLFLLVLQSIVTAFPSGKFDVLDSPLESTDSPETIQTELEQDSIDSIQKDERTVLHLSNLSEGFVPEAFFIHWLTNYIISKFGVDFDVKGNSTNSSHSQDQNGTLDKFLDDENLVKTNSLIKVDSGNRVCAKGKRRDKLGNCRKPFSG